MTLEVNDSNFKQEVLESDSIVMVDFWASWCGPCKMLAPIVDQVAEALQGKAKIFKMNVDDNPLTPSSYGIRSIPTMILFKGGEQVGIKIGMLQKDQIISWIESHM